MADGVKVKTFQEIMEEKRRLRIGAHAGGEGAGGGDGSVVSSVSRNAVAKGSPLQQMRNAPQQQHNHNISNNSNNNNKQTGFVNKTDEQEGDLGHGHGGDRDDEEALQQANAIKKRRIEPEEEETIEQEDAACEQSANTPTNARMDITEDEDDELEQVYSRDKR